MLPILSFIQRIGINKAMLEGELFSRSGYIDKKIFKIYRKRATQQ